MKKKFTLFFAHLLCVALLASCNETPGVTESQAATETEAATESEASSAAEETGAGTEEETEENVTETEKQTETETEPAPKPDPADIPDFLVEVEAGRDVRILQLSDTQVVDSTQQRTPDRLGDVLYNYWLPEKINDRCYNYIRETVAATDPDLILITGDLVYGEFDDNGTALLSFIEFMESFGIPWAPVFGNHENESAKGADWQCEQLENAEHCLFEQKTLTGNGNYSVGILQGGKLIRVFYMLDSNGCAGASSTSLANGQTKTSVGFGADQIEWYTRQIHAIHAISPDTKISFAYHIQTAIFRDAYAKYGFTGSGTKANPINIDRLPNKAEGDFGYLGADLKSVWDADKTVYNGMKALGADSVFVGHEHANSASVVYDGIRFQYGQKSSTYDRANYVNMATGAVESSYSEKGTPLIGGTLMLLGEDGAIRDAYIYLCENAGGNIDWDQWEVEEEDEKVPVSGLQIGTDLTLESGLSAATKAYEGKNAFAVTAANQGKIYFEVADITEETEITFTVFVPDRNTTLNGLGEFAIRYKGSSGNGYISFKSAGGDAFPLTKGEWQTFTVKPSDYGTSLTEFAFIIPAGNTVYFTEITFN